MSAYSFVEYHVNILGSFGNRKEGRQIEDQSFYHVSPGDQLDNLVGHSSLIERSIYCLC